MSVRSGQSGTPSILKRTSTLREHLKLSYPNVNKVRFVLPHSQNVHSILRDFLENGHSRDYENLICAIRDSEFFSDDLSSLLKEASDCISLMNNELRLFVDAVLCVRWADRDDKLVHEYQTYLMNLVSAHNYHAKVVIDHLVAILLPGPDEAIWEDGKPTNEDCIKCANVHTVLGRLLKIVPMCEELFLNSLIKHFPYFKKGVHVNEYYLHNLLWVLDYRPNLRPNILHLIFSKLILMDVNAPRDVILEAYEEDDDGEDMFPMDDTRTIKSTTSISTNNVLVETFDVCLNRTFKYIISDCHDPKSGELDWERAKCLYRVFISIFDQLILPTYKSHHVQFCWFLLCGFKSTFVEAFLEHLWKKVIDPNVPAVFRQTSVEYIASLVARASFITLRMMKPIIEQLASWIHTYINTQDGLECVNSDVRVHSVFYSTCQALFYVTTFRHREMVSSKKNLTFLQNLNFTKIVTSRLNPLRVCQPAVVQNFAAFTRNYQLAYCYSIMEHNARNIMPIIYQGERGSLVRTSATLEANFPFDPFILKRAGAHIRPKYREYEEFESNADCDDQNETDTNDTDDFLEPEFDSQISAKFSYSTSPGYQMSI